MGQRRRLRARSPRGLPPSLRGFGPPGPRKPPPPPKPPPPKPPPSKPPPSRPPKSPPGRGPRGGPGVRSRASLTFKLRPWKLRPLNSSIAFWASVSELISTKPKPRDLPVARSVITCADSQTPAVENSSFRSSLVVSKLRLPTKSFLPILAPWPEAPDHSPGMGGDTSLVRRYGGGRLGIRRNREGHFTNRWNENIAHSPCDGRPACRRSPPPGS